MPEALVCMEVFDNQHAKSEGKLLKTFEKTSRFGVFLFTIERITFSLQDPLKPQCRLKRLLQDFHRLHWSQLWSLFPASLLSRRGAAIAIPFFFHIPLLNCFYVFIPLVESHCLSVASSICHIFDKIEGFLICGVGEVISLWTIYIADFHIYWDYSWP